MGSRYIVVCREDTVESTWGGGGVTDSVVKLTVFPRVLYSQSLCA